MEKLGNYEDQSIDILKKQGKPKIKELAEKYDDVEKVDKLIATQQGVNEVANIMTTNLQKMLKNQEDLGVFTHLTYIFILFFIEFERKS